MGSLILNSMNLSTPLNPLNSLNLVNPVNLENLENPENPVHYFFSVAPRSSRSRTTD